MTQQVDTVDTGAVAAPTRTTPAGAVAAPGVTAPPENWLLPLSVLIVGMFMSVLDISIVNVAMPENDARLPLRSRLALKRAAFVLIHPGTRQAEKVVDWKAQDGTEPPGERKDGLLEAVLKSAGVDLITIRAGDAHTVADLVELFDLGETE